MKEENTIEVTRRLSFILKLSKDIYNTPQYIISPPPHSSRYRYSLHLLGPGKGPHVSTSSFHTFFVWYVIHHMKLGTRNIS
jgi:hypothetical protein